MEFLRISALVSCLAVACTQAQAQTPPAAAEVELAPNADKKKCEPTDAECLKTWLETTCRSLTCKLNGIDFSGGGSGSMNPSGMTLPDRLQQNNRQIMR